MNNTDTLSQQLQRYLPAEPQTARTGSGATPQGQPPVEEDPYIVPARPSTLTTESNGELSNPIRLARRRLEPAFGRRRIG